MSDQKRLKGLWGSDHPHSFFALYPREFTPSVPYYTKILLTEYCKQKNISRKQAKTLVQKHWLAVTRVHGRLWVHEVCPEEINQSC